MSQYRKRDYTPPLGRKLELYRQIMLRERQSLLVDQDRLKWILEHYPPEKNGTPILIETDDHSISSNDD